MRKHKCCWCSETDPNNMYACMECVRQTRDKPIDTLTATVKRLEEEKEKLQLEVDGYKMGAGQTITSLQADIHRLREGLEFYADRTNYDEREQGYMCHGEPHSYYTSPIKSDKEARAASLLKPEGTDET